MQADIAGAAGLGGVLGWWWAGFVRARPLRPPAVRTWLLLAAAAVAAGIDILALAGPAPAAAGVGVMAGAVVLRVLVDGGIAQWDREGGAG